MEHSSQSPSQVEHRQVRMRHMRLLAVYLIALVGLIAWESREHYDEISSDCAVGDSGLKSSLHSRTYERMLDWASSESVNHIAVIAIPHDLEEIQGNVCLARAYVADLLRTIAPQHPAEIVIDKFYGPAACVKDPQTTQELIGVVQSLNMPVVLGESTDTLPVEVQNSCLVRKPQLDFGAANVRYGITRLNPQKEKVPLQWGVLSADPATSSANAATADSLSWAAVEAYDADYAHRRRLQELLRTGSHPYANLNMPLARETSTELLCDAGTPAMRQRWGLTCAEPAQHLNLLGKVVLIGSEDDRDHWPVLDSVRWGFELQATYIQVMLSGSYLRAVSIWLALYTFAAFIFMIEGLPTLLEIFGSRWEDHWFLSHAYEERRYAWVIFWTVFFLSVLTVLALSLGYLPPLAVFGDICLLAITRLLFFAAESTGTQFHQPKREVNMAITNRPFADVAEKPGGEGGTPGIAASGAEVDSVEIDIEEEVVDSEKPGGETGTPG